MELVPGARLDRYELLCPVAHGGMASVWVARLTGKHGFEKLFAVKTILPIYAQDPRFQTMFLDEAKVASRIEHANVAQVLDLGEANDVLYLVMEWVDGDSLSKLARVVRRQKEQIPLGVVLRVLADTCGGLHAAHEVRGDDGEVLGVVHRDVSPQNILVTTRGIAKLIDFGVVKARGRVAGETVSGQLKGKIHYMAPEQAVGKSVDRLADIWSIAAVAYHLLAGVPVFDGENELATLHMLTSGASPPPLPPSVPAPIAAVIMGALHPDPVLRSPRTALELQQAFEGAMLETGWKTSVADVASFASPYLVDRAEARRTALDTAVRAAAERRRIEGILTPLAGDSSTGVQPTALEVDVPLEPFASFGSVPSVASTATLGSAASEVAGSPTRPSPPRGRVAGLLALFALSGLGVGLLWHNRADTDTHPAAPEASVAPAPPAAQAVAPAAAPEASVPASPSSAVSAKPATSSGTVKPPARLKAPAPHPSASPPAKKDYGF
jgi:eukaryotic-like serine/threonine-protein kinase